MEQLPHRRHRIKLRQRLGTVRRQIAQVFNQLGFDEDFRADCVFESGFMDEGAEIVLVGELEGGIAFVEPLDDLFQRGKKEGGERGGTFSCGGGRGERLFRRLVGAPGKGGKGANFRVPSCLLDLQSFGSICQLHIPLRTSILRTLNVKFGVVFGI